MPLTRGMLGYPSETPDIRTSPVDPSAAAGPAGASRASPALWFLLIVGLLVLARLVYEWGERVD